MLPQAKPDALVEQAELEKQLLIKQQIAALPACIAAVAALRTTGRVAALASLAGQAPNAEVLTRLGAITDLLAALQGSAAPAAMEALRDLAGAPGARRELLRGLPLVVAALRKGCAPEHGCAVLRQLAREQAGLVAEQGGLACLIDQMREHPEAAEVQASALAALANLTLSSSNRRACAEQGGIGLALRALRTHAAAVGVQRDGCGLLGNLARTLENGEAILASGGVGLVLAALESHEDPLVQCAAIGAACNLAVHEAAAAAIVASGGRALVERALGSPSAQVRAIARVALGKIE